MTAVLALERVTYSYPGAAAPALRDVTLTIGDGEFVVLAGRSGGGKSTLLRAANGLVPHFHGGEIEGELRVAGFDVRTHGPGQLATAVGSLFQDPETQVVMGTVRSELAFPLENRGEPAAAVARGVEEAALALGVAHLLERPTHELSGGELQRVALGAALAGRPRLVLLDEPTSQLDPVAGDELIGLLRRLNEEWGTTIILAEHRLERCLASADRVLALVDGGLACDGPPRDFLAWAADAAPALETPGARLIARAGLTPPPVGVKQARATLRAAGALEDREPHEREQFPPTRERTGHANSPPQTPSATAGGPARAIARLRGRSGSERALSFKNVWFEAREGATILRAIDLALAPGERVALMGRNGAGKSTLLRHAAGLAQPTRGKVDAAGRVALLLQNPNDYLVHERVGDEAPADALAAAGLAAFADRHPRDLSGGERQRLALAIVLGGEEDPPAVLCLDEPTRGMDRAHKADLAVLLARFAATGTALLVATHDPEFAAAFAERVVLLGDGRPIADGPASEVLSGGWYFATETARILGGAGGVLDPEAGAALVRRRLGAPPPPLRPENEPPRNPSRQARISR
ncbi:ABC transporter ATP-binding protein [Conexibacter woesei]|uniref:ABC transporter related protein n=1 Tax=Conexibacter woesei (strain DSM 14684 / CCUG 47730 / CIP 108061 / JCM 11494 / NBRC 100937 / ID131577) TaxID=469383 RepID=D3F2F0_CONWI|nr:ABC transporter ATP-binding protein [Conexibacter woesei]ADB52216.1 ABC transporter related protein [Conexibacter woesei DSM 14684]